MPKIIELVSGRAKSWLCLFEPKVSFLSTTIDDLSIIIVMMIPLIIISSSSFENTAILFITFIEYLIPLLSVCTLSLQLCPTLCDPMDCSPPGSSVHRILQTRRLEWVAMPSSRRPSRGRDRTPISYIFCIGRQVLYHQPHLGSPLSTYPKCQILCSLFIFSIHSHNLQPKTYYNLHFIDEEMEAYWF